MSFLSRMGIVNPYGGSGTDQGRDGACTPKWLCDLMGLFDVDPCSNPRSHVQALEHIVLPFNGLVHAVSVEEHQRPFINPPYARGQVIQWVTAYQHTDYTFLLRFDPSTEWFEILMKTCRYLWFPDQRIEFEPPPGVKFSSNPFPHALYLRSEPNDALLACGYTFACNG